MEQKHHKKHMLKELKLVIIYTIKQLKYINNLILGIIILKSRI